ncbi:hypothetical protein EMCRGX_G004067 [Ephydatia muelleri]
MLTFIYVAAWKLLFAKKLPSRARVAKQLCESPCLGDFLAQSGFQGILLLDATCITAVFRWLNAAKKYKHISVNNVERRFHGSKI